MSRGPDAGTLLRRALARDAAAAGCRVSVTSAQATRWASATFTGAQHRLTLEGEDDAVLAEWLGGVNEADLPMRGHLVADVALVSVTRGGGRAEIVLEGLTVEQ